MVWSQPTGGAPVTGYIIHYTNSSGHFQNVTASAGSTTSNITGLTDGETYTISVEATSVHLSGESGAMNITLGIYRSLFMPLSITPLMGHFKVLQEVWWLLLSLPQSQ